MQCSFSFIFVRFCHFRYYSLNFARLVASLLRESLYKRQMTHIHVWSTGVTHVKAWCWCEKIRQRFDQKCVSLWCISALLSQVAWDHTNVTMWKRLPLQYGSQVSTSTGQTQTKQFWSNPSLAFSFTKGIFFKRITSGRLRVPLTFRQINCPLQLQR